MIFAVKSMPLKVGTKYLFEFFGLLHRDLMNQQNHGFGIQEHLR
jgi:hypothetical protein